MRLLTLLAMSTTDFDEDFDAARAVIVQADDKIIAAGDARVGGNSPDFALVRYNASGTVDTTFGVDSRVITDFSGNSGSDGATSVLIKFQPDSKIIVAGNTQTSSDSNFALARYLTNGDLDATFGTGGKVVTNLTGSAAQAYRSSV